VRDGRPRLVLRIEELALIGFDGNPADDFARALEHELAATVDGPSSKAAGDATTGQRVSPPALSGSAVGPAASLVAKRINREVGR
jgi:hypothetical protein